MPPAQIGYGATILSFLGGVHWGLAMTNVGGQLGTRMVDQRYMWSVLPCLMAWPTIAMPVPQAAAIQVGGARGHQHSSGWLGVGQCRATRPPLLRRCTGQPRSVPAPSRGARSFLGRLLAAVACPPAPTG